MMDEMLKRALKTPLRNDWGGEVSNRRKNINDQNREKDAKSHQNLKNKN